LQGDKIIGNFSLAVIQSNFTVIMNNPAVIRSCFTVIQSCFAVIQSAAKDLIMHGLHIGYLGDIWGGGKPPFF